MGASAEHRGQPAGLFSCRLCRQTHEACGVLRRDLQPGLHAQCVQAEGAQILVELKLGEMAIASIPAAFPRSIRVSRALSPAGSLSRTM
jgi:hypothetical protein